MTKLDHAQGLVGAVLLAIGVGCIDWRAGLASGGALLFFDYVLERRHR